MEDDAGETGKMKHAETENNEKREHGLKQRVTRFNLHFVFDL